MSFTVLIYFLSYLSLNVYSSSLRHTNLSDIVKIFNANTIALFILSGISANNRYLFKGTLDAIDVPLSVNVINYLLSMGLITASRILAKFIYHRIFYYKLPTKNILIYGAGAAGSITKDVLDKDTTCNYNIKGFIDDNKTKQGKILGGVKILSQRYALNPSFLDDNDIDELILSINKLSAPRKRKIVDKCLSLDLHVKNVPPFQTWINGELSARQITRVKIEDLLDRKPIQLEKENVKREVQGKVLLVTGAAGSIGSEIAKQLVLYKPKKLIILDQSETGLYDIERHLHPIYDPNQTQLEVIIGDISNKTRIEEVFREFTPDIVYHAAAYKHVPMMEKNPSEAILVNVCGSKNIADAAVKYNTEKFVMVSTDKAVNPTNVMGASKRLAEIYIQSLGKTTQCPTKFVTTRFGNVLGSNGSVIPLFREQIEKGGPITVTSDRITRYFMTIPEACQLVLEAGAMGKGGEIFVFDMGEAVKIIDVAKKMIKLSGLIEGEDIDIKITGLRPGEKLYEELLNNEENTIPTHHPKIMAGKVREYVYEDVILQYESLFRKINVDDHKLIAKVKDIVPEYVSNNSIFEELDKKNKLV
ncbi:nucleoside-diphosphate sugar epimerase/dehydratase [Flammeovirga sp. SJP92]|uniref:polysaccharide biosynthesis protein n=1 Tax=Flammeovirga sp. SJP92 TaxID=1775430 RepID=UPI0020A458C4|nr:nucleoside-diphosphate sugar epimerase/dehydratase [Flammeovirga sp. SJP92]